MTFGLLLLETLCQTDAFQHPAEQYLREVWPAVTRALKEAGIACELNLVRCCIIFRFCIMFCRQCQEARPSGLRVWPVRGEHGHASCARACARSRGCARRRRARVNS